MDSVLKPEILHIGSRHYRKNFSSSITDAYLKPVGHLEEELDTDEVIEKDFEQNLADVHKQIEAVADGFLVKLHIPPLFQSFVVGGQHSRRKNLEKEFNCHIKFPTYGTNSSLVSVKASSKLDLLNVCRRISWVVLTARSRCQPTHFICLPANTPSIQDSFNNFRDTVLKLAAATKSSDFDGVELSVFHKSSTLHFTLVTLVLADEAEVARANDILKSFCDSSEGRLLFSSGPLQLTLKGLEYMNDDPSSVHVLYAKVADTPEFQRFQRISDALHALFTKHNLISKTHSQDVSVKLHMTLMNSRLKAEKEGRSVDDRRPFSIVGILREMKNYCFAENYLFDCIYLSDRMAFDSSAQFYKSYCKIKFREAGERPYFEPC